MAYTTGSMRRFRTSTISLYTLVILLTTACYGQPSDILVMMKKNHSVQRYYAGSNIKFTAINGAYRDAEITRIKNDSIYLKEYLVQIIPTTAGFNITDTLGSLSYNYHYNEIKFLGYPRNKKFNMAGSGASLLGGGILLTLGSLVVLVADKEKFSPGLMIGSAALGGLGYLLMKTAGQPMQIGQHGYHLQYINMQPTK